MPSWTRGSLFAALNAAGFAALLVLGPGPALADPDPAPGDPGVVAAPVGPPAPPQLVAPPPAPPGDPLAPPPPNPLASPPLPNPLAPPPNPLASPLLPAPFAQPAAAGPAAGQDPTPFTGTAPFGPPKFLPANGSTVGSPVQVQAAATITGTFARMEVWVDGVKKYTETSSKTLNTSISLAVGSHRFGIFAVNTAGTKWEGVSTATVK